jgi:DNA-directed RNA polymerase specialized sigma24 family protein
VTKLPGMPSTHAYPIGNRETRPASMERMLRELPVQHREIIVATFFRRRTTREAAALLDLTPDAVKARLYQAMRDLSDRVAADRPDHSGTHRAA